MNAIAEEGAKFAEDVLAPLNQSGDQEGCTWSEEGVATPTGFPEAYQQYVDNGWPSLSCRCRGGWPGHAQSAGYYHHEMVGTANWSWGMYPGLSHGAINTIEEHGSPEQKEQYLTNWCRASGRVPCALPSPIVAPTWDCCAPKPSPRLTAPMPLPAQRYSSVPVSTI